MTDTDIVNLIEDTLAGLPERMSGNEANEHVARKLRELAIHHRAALLGALQSFLGFRVAPAERRPEDAVREARLWMALDVAEQLGLSELKAEIESLVVDVRNGKVLLPVHEKSVARYAQSL
jgi:hypothetical protein